jgi:uncharacterized membrane protein YeaQ/YmgE (transglycosylase-associated protein family)
MSTIFNVVSWLVFGLVTGAIARLLVPGKQNMTWLGTCLLGIAGSLVGGIVSWLIFGSSEDTVNAAGWILSILGAIAVIVAYSKWKGTKSGSSPTHF